MKIEWNKVTWYSKLGAIIFFILVVPVLAFYIGTQYEKSIQILNSTPTPVPEQTTPKPISKVDLPDEVFCQIINGEADRGEVYRKYNLDNYVLNYDVPVQVLCPLKINDTTKYFAFFDKKGALARIKISNSNNKFIQELTADSFYLEAAALLKDDVNFDGYKDLLVTDFLGASMVTQSYLVFNPTKGLFETRVDLSKLGNPWFDPIKKQIQTSFHRTAETGGNGVLDYIDGKYVISKSVDTDYEGEFRSSKLIQVTKERVNGKLATTSVEYVDTGSGG